MLQSRLRKFTAMCAEPPSPKPKRRLSVKPSPIRWKVRKRFRVKDRSNKKPRLFNAAPIFSEIFKCTAPPVSKAEADHRALSPGRERDLVLLLGLASAKLGLFKLPEAPKTRIVYCGNKIHLRVHFKAEPSVYSAFFGDLELVRVLAERNLWELRFEASEHSADFSVTLPVFARGHSCVLRESTRKCIEKLRKIAGIP